MNYTIFTDGASKGNPGPGGWGSIIVTEKEVVEMGGRESHTTNNRMELTAVLKALEYVNIEARSRIKIYTDSSYLINGITKWVRGWEANGWKTKEKNDVLNKDIWQLLAGLVHKMETQWVHVGGHIGVRGNERCDEIATRMAEGKSVDLYHGSLGAYPIVGILDVSHDKSLSIQKQASSSRSRAQAYSYVSKVGGVIKIHKTWKECEERVKGKPAKFKKALSADEEGAIVQEFRNN